VSPLTQDFEVTGAGDVALRLIAFAGGEVFEEMLHSQRCRGGDAAQPIRGRKRLKVALARVELLSLSAI